MDKMTKSKLEKMTTKELIKFLNNCVLDITYTSINASSVKERMFERIRDVFSPEFLLQDTNYVHHDFSIPINGLNVKIKIGTKSTGKIERVTKLRSKNVVGVGKFKVDNIYFSYSIPCFEVEDENKFLLKIEKEWSSRGDTVWLPTSSTKTFEEMASSENKHEFILANYKMVEDTNKKYNQTNRVYSSIEEEIGLYMAQPFIKVAYFGKDKDLIKRLPKDLQIKIKNGELNWLEATIKVVIDNNRELIENVIKSILNG